ncbi:MAG: ATP-binding cassette domain-containing protein [Firmicutes bacterium]|nr:ATP-binding cassette domain-containing protein [Bacillota bacterium]
MLRPLVQVDKLTKSYGFHDILKDISFLIREGEKVALIGPNGVGKSTVLKILAGVEVPTSGTITWFQDRLLIAYVPQDPDFASENTPWNVLLAEEARLGSAARASAAEALSRFRFTRAESQLRISALSGGQKTRLALARTWLSRPELMLLDEPTNHLDQDGLHWLKDFVRGYPGTVLVVSHDRYFLDSVVSRVIELSPTQAVEYEGTYTDYREAKQAAYVQQLAQYESEQKRIHKLEEAIDRQLQWFEKSHRDAGKDSDIRIGVKEFYRGRAKRIARRAKSNLKRLEGMKESSVEKPKEEAGITLRGFNEGASGQRILLAEELTQSFDKLLFRSANFSVFRGEKVGIVGANGCGKTTLLNLVLSRLTPTEGSLWVTPGARIGYLDQELESLDPGVTVLEEVMKVAEWHAAEAVTRARTMLGCFLFSAEDIGKRICVLSTGERKRVALVKLLLSSFNLLLLDEPTDHFDLPAREKLEEALQAYTGTLLLVSHDRYLLRRVCTKLLAIEGQRIATYADYDEYERRRQRKTQSQQDALSEGSRPSKDERLLLEIRMAWLQSELSHMSREDPRHQALEQEFFAIVRRCRS